MLHFGQANTDSTDLLVWIGKRGIKKRAKWFIQRTSSNICAEPHLEQYVSRLSPPSTLTLRGLVPNMMNMRDYVLKSQLQSGLDYPFHGHGTWSALGQTSAAQTGLTLVFSQLVDDNPRTGPSQPLDCVF